MGIIGMNYNRFQGLNRIHRGKIGNSFYHELVSLTKQFENQVVTYIKWQDPNYKSRKFRLKWNDHLRIYLHVILNFGNFVLIGLVAAMLATLVLYFVSTKGFAIAILCLQVFAINHVMLTVCKLLFTLFLSFHHPHVVKIEAFKEDGTILIEYYDNESFIHWSRVYHYFLIINPDRSYWIKDMVANKKVSNRYASGILRTLQEAVMVGVK
jgi:hypothetical protein